MAAARRRGVATPEALAGRAKTLVGIQLWRRAAKMVAACVPTAPAADAADLIPAARDRRLGELGLAAADDHGDEPGGELEASTVAAAAEVAAPSGHASARGPEWFQALRLVYGRGPPQFN